MSEDLAPDSRPPVLLSAALIDRTVEALEPFDRVAGSLNAIGRSDYEFIDPGLWLLAYRQAREARTALIEACEQATTDNSPGRNDEIGTLRASLAALTERLASAEAERDEAYLKALEHLADLKQVAATPTLRIPATLTPALSEILGMPNFRAGPIAHLFRDTGETIPRKVEEETAFVVHWLLTLFQEHGPGWKKPAGEEIGRRQAIVLRAREAAEAAAATATSAATTGDGEGGDDRRA